MRPAPLTLTQLCMEQANPSGPPPDPSPSPLLLSAGRQAKKRSPSYSCMPSFTCVHPKLFRPHTFPYSCPPPTHSSLPRLHSGSQPLHLYKTFTSPTHSYSFSYSYGKILKSFPWRKKKPLLLLPLTVDTAPCPPPLPVQHLEDVCPVLTLLHHLFLPSTHSPKAALLDATDDFLVAGSHGPLAAFIQSTSSEALEKWSSSWFLGLWLFGLMLLNVIVKVLILQSSFQMCLFPEFPPSLVHLFVILGSFSTSPAIRA